MVNARTQDHKYAHATTGPYVDSGIPAFAVSRHRVRRVNGILMVMPVRRVVIPTSQVTGRVSARNEDDSGFSIS